MSEPWMSAEEVAAHLGVTKDAVYVSIADKAMPAHKIGRLWTFQASEVDSWVLSGGTAGKMTVDTFERQSGGEAPCI